MTDNTKWWEEPVRDRAEALMAVFVALRQTSSSRLTDYSRWAALYVGRDPSANSVVAEEELAAASYLPINEIANMVDTQVARITKAMPRPMHLTQEGSWDQRNRAKRMDQWVEGLFLAERYPEKGRSTFNDACVFGTGVIKTIGRAKAKPPGIELVHPWEVLVDDLEALYGEPRNFFQFRAVDRGVAMAAYPKSRAAISVATALNVSDMSDTPVSLELSHADCVLAVEAWHLPSGEDANDGRHCIVIGGKIVVDRPWTRKQAPFAFIHYRRRPDGRFWGIGIPEASYGVQCQVANIMRDIQESQHRFAKPRVLVHKSSKINTDHLTSDVATIIQWEGSVAPIFSTPQAMSQDVYLWAERLRSMMYQINGISELASRMEKPAGLDSGRALIIHSDIESQRHLVVGKAWEQLALDVGALVVDEVRAQAEEIPAEEIIVRAGGKNGWRKLTWADVQLAPDEYTIQTYPVSALASTPAARIDQVDELAAKGYIPPEEALRLLDWPDLESYIKRQLSDREIAERQVARILEGEWSSPESMSNVLDLPVQNLAVAFDVARRSLLMAMDENAPDEVIDLLRRYLTECKAWMDRAQQGAQASPPNAGPPPAEADLPPELMPDAGETEPIAPALALVPSEAGAMPPEGMPS